MIHTLGETVTGFEPYSVELIETLIFEDRIELIYRETPNFTCTTSLSPNDPSWGIFKKVVTAKDSKLVFSDRINGKVIPAQEESYEFEV